jgi:hypothetical protein
MIRNKVASVCLVIVSLIGFIPLIAASWLSGRGVQRELADITLELWKKK